MAFPFAAIGLGLNALGAVGGLLGGNAAAKRAEEARARALNDYKIAQDQKYRAAVSADTRNLYGLKGRYGDLLLSGARTSGALDAAGLGGGLQRYNSTATIGDILNRQSGYNSSLQDAIVQANQREQQMAIQNQMEALQMQYGTANQDVNYARNMQQNAYGSFGNLMQQVPSLFPQGQPAQPAFGSTAGYFANNPNPNYQTNDNPAQSYPAPVVQGNPNMFPEVNQQPIQSPNFNSQPDITRGVQPMIQSATSSFSPAGNSYGPAYNGGFNSKLPKIGGGGQYVAPMKAPQFTGY